ncbi:MAG: efflux RND transporter periplasmic adaptor subunit [Tannerella sp.]|jgi:cobalt-zinc-cadmium efflux system membrane fusion protein|nr:efflux RND transporter periplasmic adaptor subunit [Tannerella sp.]
MKKIFILICLPLLFACTHRPAGDSAASAAYTVEGEYIRLSSDSPLLSRIKTQQAEVSGYRAVFHTSGAVRAIPSGYAEIAAPFAGRITRSFVRLGQRVGPGSPLFEISSPSFYEAQKAYFQARHEMELARKNFDREHDLMSHSVGAARTFEEAATQYELRRRDCEQALAALLVYQVDTASMTPGQPLAVRSPIAGEVVMSSAVIGQYLKDDAGPLAVVADLAKVWVVARVREKDIPVLRQIDGVDVSLSVMPDTAIAGAVYYVGELLDDETRSVEVIVECDNRGRLFKPNMYGTVRFTARPAPAVVIPGSAVLQDGDSPYVLVDAGDNRFRRTKITVASSDGQQAVVTAGIRSGDRVMTEGAFYFAI